MCQAKLRKISFGERTMFKHICMLILPLCLLHLSAAGPSIADEVKDENARNCIQARTIKRTEVLDDLNIFFFMRGKSIYHNILLRQCTGLSRDRRFSYGASTNSLCHLDRIRILHDSGSAIQEGRSCQLGYFHPVNAEDIAAIIERTQRLPQVEPLPPAEPEEIITETNESGDPPPHDMRR